MSDFIRLFEAIAACEAPAGTQVDDVLAQFQPAYDAAKGTAPAWRVCDNVTGQPVGVKTHDTRSSAESACGALNTQAGPGGRYGVEIREGGEWRRDNYWLECAIDDIERKS